MTDSNTIQIDQAIASFADMSRDEKVHFLALLACEITVAGRETYEVGGDGVADAPLLRQLNEVQHRMVAAMRDLIGGEARLPDETLMRTLMDHPHMPALQRLTQAAYRRAMDQFRGSARSGWRRIWSRQVG